MKGVAPPEDALDLRLRLVRLFFRHSYGAEPAGVWFAPAPVILLGGRPGGPTLAVPMRWGSRVAASPRNDTTLVVYSANRPVEPIAVDLDFDGSSELPSWGADLPPVARTLLRCSGEVKGAVLLSYMDVPEESGLAAEAAQRCAVARALISVSGIEPTPAELLPMVGGEEGEAAAMAASLFGRPGHAMLIPAGFAASPRTSPQPRHAPFDPAAAGLRLVVVALRRTAPEAPEPRWAPDPSEDSSVAEAFETLLDRGPEGLDRLGAVLNESQQASRGRREPAEADRVVEITLSVGALGARATSPSTVLALVPTPALRSLRTALTGAFRDRGLPVPRFLTTGTFPLEGSEQRPSLLEV